MRYKHLSSSRHSNVGSIVRANTVLRNRTEQRYETMLTEAHQLATTQRYKRKKAEKVSAELRKENHHLKAVLKAAGIRFTDDADTTILIDDTLTSPIEPNSNSVLFLDETTDTDTVLDITTSSRVTQTPTLNFSLDQSMVSTTSTIASHLTEEDRVRITENQALNSQITSLTSSRFKTRKEMLTFLATLIQDALFLCELFTDYFDIMQGPNNEIEKEYKVTILKRLRSHRKRRLQCVEFRATKILESANKLFPDSAGIQGEGHEDFLRKVYTTYRLFNDKILRDNLDKQLETFDYKYSTPETSTFGKDQKAVNLLGDFPSIALSLEDYQDAARTSIRDNTRPKDLYITLNKYLMKEYPGALDKLREFT